MAQHDKVEPFWSRPLRARPKTAKPGTVPPPPDAEPPRKPAPPDAPREPSFKATQGERRARIAELIAEQDIDQRAPEVEPERAEAPARRAEPFSKRPEPARAPPSFAPEPAPAPPAAVGGWVYVSDADAARHRLFGVHGWLVLLALLICVTLFRAILEMIDFWATTDHGGLAAWIMAVLRSGMALWAALILGQLIGRSRAFPANFVAYGALNIIYLGLFGLAFAHLTNNMVFAGVAGGVAATLLAIAYVLRSRRVNVTYRRRVRAKEIERACKGAAPVAAQAPSSLPA
jgi:hypothetical protein